MEGLINTATDSFVSSFFASIEKTLIEFFMQLIQLVNTSLLGIFDMPIVSDFVQMGMTVSRILFGATVVILMIDVIEEASSMKSDQAKAIEWPTILFNLVKAAIFSEAAPQLSIIALRIVVEVVGQFDPSPYLSGMMTGLADFALGTLIAIIAVGGFAAITMMRFGAILIQAATAFLYVPDIVRGHTTSMGNWIRQTVAILLTFFLQYILFYQGLVCCFEAQLIPALMLWLAMFYVSKYLDKYGMSSGITGAISSASNAVQGAVRTVSAFTG